MPKKKNTRAHRQRLSISGCTFHPAKLNAAGLRSGKARTTFSLISEETTDPAVLVELVAAVGGRGLMIKIEPDESEQWEGPGRILKSGLTPPKVEGPDRHSTLSIALEVVSDNPQTHLDLFNCRLAMDGRDAWECWGSLTLVQSDFALLGGSGDPAAKDPPK